MYNNEIMGALAELIKSEYSEEAKEYRNLILKRIAEETEVKPTRIPAPLNITELGGYYNLLEQMKVKMPDASEFETDEEYRKYKQYLTAQKMWLEEQKQQLQLSIIRSALGLPT